MRSVRSFFGFWYDFIVRGHWTVADGVVLALTGTALLALVHVVVWWLLPPAVVGLLALSLVRPRRPWR
ncbi:hypothetical protein [Pseudonocardia sp.]|jgi:hypothetical protein|uniref:hypothetical protein n=1 Tax=Pseudonocardia sp. TaxID=60912 RepID=UPI0031FD4271